MLACFTDCHCVLCSLLVSSHPCTSLKVDQLFLSHHEVLKSLLVRLLNGSPSPSVVEQILILILNVGSGTHRSKIMILEWEEFMKLMVERLRVSLHHTACIRMLNTLYQRYYLCGIGSCLASCGCHGVCSTLTVAVLCVLLCVLLGSLHTGPAVGSAHWDCVYTGRPGCAQ